MNVFVTVGNAQQPFNRLIHEIERLIESDTIQGTVFVQNGHTPVRNGRMSCEAFITMDQFLEKIRRADVVVSHGGAGTIIQCIQVGKMPVVVPRSSEFGEHIDDHQSEFVLELDRLGKICLVKKIENLDSAMKSAKKSQAESRRAGMKNALLESVKRDLKYYEHLIE